MTSATRSVAVVATRLPNIDRRALSQAWFSALHLAQPPDRALRPSPTLALRTALPPPASAPPPGNTPPGRTPPLPVMAGSRPARRNAPAGGPVSAFTERRAPSGDLARRIERAIARHGAPRPSQTTAIAINAGDGRIQLLVRSDGATTRIIALCPPRIRERVDRALAHARFALAASGEITR